MNGPAGRTSVNSRMSLRQSDALHGFSGPAAPSPPLRQKPASIPAAVSKIFHKATLPL